MDRQTAGKNPDKKTPGKKNPGRAEAGTDGTGSAGKRRKPAAADDLGRVSGGYDPTISGSISF